MSSDPPEVKVGPSRPTRNRRRYPYEDTRKLKVRNVKEMKCKTCQQLSHNKQTCPDKDKTSSLALLANRRRGKPRREVVDIMPKLSQLSKVSRKTRS